MIGQQEQNELLSALETTLGITDVYFHKGQLYVINDYDVEAVEEFLDETGWAADVEMVEPEDYSPYGTVNS